MTREQYKRYLQLSQKDKKQFMDIAVKHNIDKTEPETWHWLKFGYVTNRKDVRKAMLDDIFKEIEG